VKIQTKLAFLLLFLSLVVIVGSGVFLTISLDGYFRSRILDELRTQTNQAAFVIRHLSINDSSGYVRLQEFAHSANLRLTLIDVRGRVLFESDLPYNKLQSMENHLHRQEVQEALRDGSGSSSRRSATIDAEMLYLAKRVDARLLSLAGEADIVILRVGLPMTQVEAVLHDIQSKIIIASSIMLSIVVGMTIIVSGRLARPIKEISTIAEQIRSGNLERRIPVRSRDEFGQLAGSLNGMVDKLRDDLEKLKKLEKIRSEFLGNVSHELRTPIFAIQGMLETLLAGAIEDEEVGRSFVERALSNTQRLNTLLGDLIEISRIESGEMKMSFRYFPIHELLEHVVSEAGETARQRHVALELMPKGPSVDVLGDKERVKQAMLNLLDNAIKYNKPGGRVTISYQETDIGLKISVEDTGIGIPGEHLPRVFERFYRVSKERSREAGGTGLGLAIVKHIIEAHGSKIDVRSKVGEGSTFAFTLRT
jgi:two-component system phosphate regulon sensor histidine kinase PhoR